MKMLIGFASFVLYGILLGSAGFTTAAVVAFLLGLGALGYGLATRTTDQLTVTSTVIYGVYAAIAVLGDASSGFTDHSDALALGVMTAVVAVGLLTGHPFTEAYARASVPREQWTSPVFKRINNGITAAWLGAFVVLTVGAIADGAGVRVPFHTALSIAAMVAAAIFTKRYPDRVTGDAAPRHATA